MGELSVSLACSDICSEDEYISLKKCWTVVCQDKILFFSLSKRKHSLFIPCLTISTHCSSESISSRMLIPISTSLLSQLSNTHFPLATLLPQCKIIYCGNVRDK